MSKNTSLHSNPFYVLGVCTRDDRRKIVEMAEERSLQLDDQLCQKARADLVNPRARLSAEISWMPGVAPSLAEKLVGSIAKHQVTLEQRLPPLARANLAAAAFELVESVESAHSVADLIREFASVVEAIDPVDVLRDINEDRVISGFPEITAVEVIDAELTNRRKAYRLVLKNLLDRMASDRLVQTMTDVVSIATNAGTEHASALIDELTDTYENEAQGFLERERENIITLIKSTENAAPRGEASVMPLLDALEKVTRSWSRVARPIQVSAKSRGIEHKASRDVAYKLRDLGIYLNNEHGMLDQAHRMTALLQDLFADSPELVERLGEDAETIADLRRKAEKRERDNAQWAKDITFRADVGLMFKEELAISPDGIRWKGRLHPLESITRVRWGAVRHSVNGIPTGTDYTIGFGDNQLDTTIQLRREATYSGFLAALWRAVGVGLAIRTLQHLEQGGSLSFGDMIVEDGAVTLTKHKFFGSNERMKLGWSDVHVWSADGEFVIGKKDDKKTYGSASYIKHWNTHLLEHVVRGGFKKGVERLSDYLKG